MLWTATQKVTQIATQITTRVNNVSKQDTTASESERMAQAIGEQDVADYLRRHPDFFEDKPTLLADLRVPHATGTAVSLVERQVAVLLGVVQPVTHHKLVRDLKAEIVYFQGILQCIGLE